jgi:hypothetical protein
VLNIATVASLSLLYVAMYSAPVQCFTTRTKLRAELSISLNRHFFFYDTETHHFPFLKDPKKVWRKRGQPQSIICRIFFFND